MLRLSPEELDHYFTIPGFLRRERVVRPKVRTRTRKKAGPVLDVPTVVKRGRKKKTSQQVKLLLGLGYTRYAINKMDDQEAFQTISRNRRA